MTSMHITLIILLITIIAFATGKVPFSVISSGIILALVLTGIRTPAEAFSGFINTNVIMFVAMFVIGAGLTKTKLIDHAQNLATVYKGNIIKNLIMDCQSYTKYRPNETTGGIFVSWRRKEELPTGA